MPDLPKPPDHSFTFQLKCGSCGAYRMLKLPAYPWPVDKPVPLQGFGQDASCPRCGKQDMRPQNSPPAEKPPPPPRGWVKDPRTKK